MIIGRHGMWLFNIHADHITSGLRTPPSGIVAVRYGTRYGILVRLTYLLLGGLSLVLHVEGSRTRPGIICGKPVPGTYL
jgi:hypothetical protein